ncbi:nucleosidase [Corynebacterium mendelii]|uniref:Nucleosidase n=1 Tax=Corynebacterium mendelii TaxID=2765362 RepID=A0A939E1E6_9CORY|nr:nucleosidase [Corynebacterium mendelii]MBN9645205.1 nucleosidase [Corynebacterium mendelii]
MDNPIVNNIPLVVSATQGEARHLDTDLPVVVTGVGTLAATLTLTELIVDAASRGIAPSCLINLGTAGALKEGVSGFFEVSWVYKHDFNDDVLEAIDGKPMLNDLVLATTGVLPEAVLATGDSFVADSATKNRLAQKASLVEMEGYAVAYVGYRFGIPVTLIKQTSDMADEKAVAEWADAVPGSSRSLGQALKTYLEKGTVVVPPYPARREFR